MRTLPTTSVLGSVRGASNTILVGSHDEWAQACSFSLRVCEVCYLPYGSVVQSRTTNLWGISGQSVTCACQAFSSTVSWHSITLQLRTILPPSPHYLSMIKVISYSVVCIGCLVTGEHHTYIYTYHIIQSLTYHEEPPPGACDMIWDWTKIASTCERQR